jgi:hypothetical protein
MAVVISLLSITMLFCVFAARCQAEDAAAKDILAWWAFDEGEGSKLTDKSSFKNNGEITGATWVKGGFGYALQFNGEDRVRVEDADSLKPVMAWSLEAWFNPAITIDKNLSGFPALITKLSGNYGYWLNFREKMGNLSMLIGNGARAVGAYCNTGVWEKDRWYHVVFTYDGKTGKLYVNGVPDGQRKLDIEPAYLGGGILIGERFKGLIGDIKLWNRTLTLQEIEQTYQVKKKKLIETAPLANKKEAAVSEDQVDAAVKDILMGRRFEMSKEKGKSPFIRVVLGDTDFGIAEGNGALRYYRAGKSNPFIEYISLSEGDKAQVRTEGIKWKHEWQEGSLLALAGIKNMDVPQGKVENKSAVPVLNLTPGEDGIAKIAASGRLNSQWESDITVVKQDKADLLSMHYQRKGAAAAGRQPVALSIKLMRWLEDEDIPLFAVKSNGQICRLQGGESVEGVKVIIPFWKQGHQLSFSVEPCQKISLGKIQGFMGGRLLTFNAGEAADKVSLQVEDSRISPVVTAGAVSLRVNERNGAGHLDIGGLPFMTVEGVENGSIQSVAGYDGSAWEVATKKNVKGGFAFTGKGRISTVLWAMEVKGKDNEICYRWKRDSIGAASAGVHLFMPYWLVGSRVEVISPAGKVTDACGNIPMRVGAEFQQQALGTNAMIAIYPTATEKITITLQGEFELASYRKSTSAYREPFDLSYYPVFYQDVEQKGVIHSFPPAGLFLIAKNGREFGIDIKYERLFAKAGKSEVSRVQLPADGVKVISGKDDVSVLSPYWKITHSRRNGGGISSIVFPYASGKDIMVSPEAVYIQSAGKVYSSSNEKSPDISAKEDEIKVSGLLKTVDGKDCGIKYQTTYQYNQGYIKRNTVFNFIDSLPVEKVGVLKLDLDPLLDQCGYKPVLAAFRKAVFPGPPLVQGKTLGIGFISLFRRGGEGIDFVPGNDTHGWRYQLSSNASEGYLAVQGNSQGGPSLVVEAYSNTERPVRVKGEKSYSYFIGLPMINKHLPGHYFTVNDSYGWFTTEDRLGKLSDNGVNLMLNHGWRGSSVGEYPSEKMSEAEKKGIADKVEHLKLAEQYGIKNVPFVAKGLLKSTLPAYKEHLWDWIEMGVSKTPPARPDAYGDMMCHEAKGWNKYLKDQIMAWQKIFSYDGIYYDFVYPAGPCCNPRHAGGERHLSVEGVLEFMEWTRDNFEVVWSHTGHYPTVMLENLSDLVWVGEELNPWYANEGRIPDLDGLAEYFEHIPNTQKVVDPGVVRSCFALPGEKMPGVLRYDMEDAKEFAGKLSLCGLFSCAALRNAAPFNPDEVMDRFKPWLDLYKSFKSVDFTKLSFSDWKNQGAVITDNPYIRAAVYSNEHEAVLVLANSENRSIQKARFKVNTEALGWGKAASYRLVKRPEGTFVAIDREALCKRGVQIELPGYGYAIYLLSIGKR